MPLTFHREGASTGQTAPFGFLGDVGIREMLRFLRSRWSVEMTGIGVVLNTIVAPVEK